MCNCFGNSDLVFYYINMGSKCKVPVDIIYIHTASLVSKGQTKTHVFEWKMNFSFGKNDLDLDSTCLDINFKLLLDTNYYISHTDSKCCVNSAEQSQVIERKPKVDDSPTARRFQLYNKRFRVLLKPSK